MKSIVCSHLPEDMQIVIEFCLCGAARQVNADVDTFKNFPGSQSGIIWKSQVMRADPLDVTLGICVRLLYPVRGPPPAWVVSVPSWRSVRCVRLRAFVRCLLLRV